MTTDLGEVDGREVRAVSIAITKAGDGLSQALSIEPQLLHGGEKVYVVLECEVDKLKFEPIADTQDWKRIHVLKAGAGTIVSQDLVLDAINEMRDRVIAADEERRGVQQLTPADTTAEHEAGGHERKAVKACVLCISEAHDRGDHKRARIDCDKCAAEKAGEVTPMRPRR